MYDKKRNLIIFPHSIPVGILEEKQYTTNDIDGGFTKVVDLGIVPDSFFGGNVRQLGMIKKFGFYACVDMFDNRIRGFHIHDPKKVTELGRKIVNARFKGIDIDWSDIPAEMIRVGAEVELIDRAKPAELSGLIKNLAKKVNQVEEDEVVTEAELDVFDNIVEEEIDKPKGKRARISTV